MDIKVRYAHGCSALFGLGLVLASCNSDDIIDPVSTTESAPAALSAPRYGGGLVSPELFDLITQWSRDSLAGKTSALTARPDLASYARGHAPALAAEAMQIMGPSGGSPGATTSALGCSCRVVGTFSGASPNAAMGPSWTASSRGAAHTAHIYHVQSGSLGEASAIRPSFTTQFRTQMFCTTPQGSACAAGCTARLYSDVQYSSKAYAEAHTWTIWNKAATTQVSDGVTLDLRRPYGGGSRRLFEKAVSAHQSATQTTFDADELANAIGAGLGITSAIVTEQATLIPALVAKLVKSVQGIVQRQGGTNGSITQEMIASYQTFFDAVPPQDITYASDVMNVYALDLSSQINMKVRGWGYHSKTGDLRSSYYMAVYVSNFSCDQSVSATPLSAGFWRYDGYAEAPLNTASLQSNVASFFRTATGKSVPVTSNQGEIFVGVCGDQVCDAFENPSSCAADCGTCGDSTCNGRFEDAFSCIEDCNWCGDGRCYGSEDAYSCVDDCGYCGDGMCYNEDPLSCEADCPSSCGDGYCVGTETWDCPWDCSQCGDGVCNGDEAPWTCPSDCP